MEARELQKRLVELATLEESSELCLSAYLSLNEDPSESKGWRQQRCDELRAVLPPISQELLEEWDQLSNRAGPAGARGVAWFARAGARAFRRVLWLDHPAETCLVAAPAPYLFPLLSLDPLQQRYIVLLCAPASVRLVELRLNTTVEYLWNNRPDLQARVNTVWLKDWYAGPEADEDLTRLLESHRGAGGRTHFVLAGAPPDAERVRTRLPKRLAALMIDGVFASPLDQISYVAAETLRAWIDRELETPTETAALWRNRLLRGSLATSGPVPVRNAIRAGRAALVLLSPSSRNGVREDIERLAAICGVPAETVEIEELERAGGVGALLRSRALAGPA